MDVVRRNIETLRGNISLDSRPGEGTTITIRLPLTLAIIEGFGVGVGEETYVLPLQAVLECIELPEEARRDEASRGVINLRGDPLPYISACATGSDWRTNARRGRTSWSSKSTASKRDWRSIHSTALGKRSLSRSANDFRICRQSPVPPFSATAAWR